MTQIVTRWCHSCQRSKPATEFYTGNTQCNECKSAARANYRTVRGRPVSHLEETDPEQLRDMFRIKRP